MLPSTVLRELRESLLDYLSTTFNLRDPEFESKLFSFLDGKDGLFRGPYVDLRLPFRKAPEGEPLPLDISPSFTPYRHQLRAFERLYTRRGHQPQHTLVTTGTGSGKTECFLYPLLDHCWREKQAGKLGIKAIVLYPLNALASDQARRFAEEIWKDDRLRGTVSAGLYVGGTGHQQIQTEDALVDSREAMRASPPDILLTNYKMLDFLLMRPQDRALWLRNGPETLRFLVLDELHTYDGAQGTDVACLIRRLKSRLGAPANSVCCVGTSATIGASTDGGASLALRTFARTIFEEEFTSDSVITEDRQALDAVVPRLTSDQSEASAFPSKEEIEAGQALTQPDAFVRHQAQVWLGLSPEDAATEESFHLELATRLKRHRTLRDILESLGGRSLSWGQLKTELAGRDPAWGDLSSDLCSSALEGFLALVATARSEEAGRQQPFLTLHLHLWARELRRLLLELRSDEGQISYSLSWESDSVLDLETPTARLPISYCRDCGFQGAATTRDMNQRVSLGPGEIGLAWFNKGRECCFIWPWPEGETATASGEDELSSAHSLSEPYWLCLRCRRLTRDKSCSCSGGTTHTAKVGLEMSCSEGPPPRFLARCPSCENDDTLRILGSRAPSLLSVALSNLNQSSFNEDKKILAFTDSVQDASHRSGFFGNRTFTFHLRTALQTALQAEGDQDLEHIAANTIAYWRRVLANPDPPFWKDLDPGAREKKLLASFLPQDLRELESYRGFLDSSRSSKEFQRELHERFGWELLMELGLNARVGRTLESSGCATVSPKPGQLEAAARLLTLELEEGDVLEQASMKEVDPAAVAHLLRVWLTRMRHRGGLWHRFMETYIREGGSSFHLSRARNPLISPFGPNSSYPKVVIDREPKFFDALSSPADRVTWLRDWAERCLGISRRDSGLNAFWRQAAQVMVNEGLLRAHRSRGNRTAWSLEPSAFVATSDVTGARCQACDRGITLAGSEAPAWEGQRCPQYRCGGTLELEPPAESYYSRLYRSGTLTRIHCDEHTGLLKREDRELLETRFKEGSAPDAPNLLVCTPTLEMGIDIGDLSSAVLCSVPPKPSNYLQRVGRAGRKTGNAVTLTMALQRPHDLYFFSEPQEMLSGTVLPPGCFLDAPEMLRRQFIAFAMDSWAKEAVEVKGLPRRMVQLLAPGGDRTFPKAFFKFLHREHKRLFGSFEARFEVKGEHQQRLIELCDKHKIENDISGAFKAVANEIDELVKLRNTTTRRIRSLEEDPTSVDDAESEKRELTSTNFVLNKLIDEERKKYPLNVLTDAGVLPNYAFPEPGVTLTSVIADGAKENRSYKTYEYQRPASVALREFAPFNTFYAEGRKVRVDEIDLGSRAQPLMETWRLCADCHHAEKILTESEATGSTCPGCGSSSWADSGQKHSLVPFRRARSLSTRLEASAVASSEERERENYRTLDLIEVTKENQAGARVAAAESFGYELLVNLELQEINFGRTAAGQGFQICGEPMGQPGFNVCLDCGHIQAPGETMRGRLHAAYCRARKEGNKPKLEHVSLYREIRSEAIRVLLPVVDHELEEKRLSFKAALQLGLRRRFQGDASHLQIKQMSEPLQTSNQRRQFLVLYDTVPGGTGFLRELWTEGKFLELLQVTHDALAGCSCLAEGKDGCYQCLFAFQVQRELPRLSSRVAQKMLKNVLDAGTWEDRQTLSDVPLDSAIESELEARFLDALGKRAEAVGGTFKPVPLRPRETYLLRTRGEQSWHVELQPDLGGSEGVAIATRPDFLIRPANGDPSIMPVAIYCDGFRYHACPEDSKARIGDDIAKRDSLLRSGRYAVMSITWKDLEKDAQGRSILTTIDDSRYRGLSKHRPSELDSARLHLAAPLEVLFHYLRHPDRDDWRRVAGLLATAWVATGPFVPKADSHKVRASLEEDPQPPQLTLDPKQGSPGALWARHHESNHRIALGSISQNDARATGSEGGFENCRITLRLYDDSASRQAETFESAWRGALHTWNLLQFLPGFRMQSTEALADGFRPAAFMPELKEGEVPKSVVAGEAGLEQAGAPSEASSDVAAETDAALEELRELATAATLPLIDAVAEQGLPLPLDDFELPVPGSALGPQAQLAWPKLEIAVLSEQEAIDREKWESAGWAILVLPLPNTEPLLGALAAATSEGDKRAGEGE